MGIERVKAGWRPPANVAGPWGPSGKGAGVGSSRVKAHCCLRCTAYTQGRLRQPETALQGILTGFRCGGLRLEMAAVLLPMRPRHGLAPLGPCTQPEVARPPQEQMPQVPRGGGWEDPACCLHRASASALLSPELWAVGLAGERSVLWKEERKCKRCWAGGKAPEAVGKAGGLGGLCLRRSSRALHPQPGCCAGFPAETLCSQEPRPHGRASSCRPHVRPRGQCVGESS